ncbi:hypothetical protein MTO96_017876 [Rhipicephalus appendiculatus]
MSWRFSCLAISAAFMVLGTTNVTNAAAVPSSIVQAEERVNELVKILSDIKKSIRPRNCADQLHAGQTTNGLYNVFLRADDIDGKVVYCDMETDGGGWTVIQRRGQFGNSAYYFYRNWTEYAEGFGDPTEEYWIGIPSFIHLGLQATRALHALTEDGEGMELRILLKNDTGDSVCVEYENFRVASEEEHFKLQLGDLLGPPGWDALRDGHNCAFTTFDQDHDNAPDNCAITFRGAWWYNRCHAANLNGLNMNGWHESFADGIEWSLRGTPGHLYHYSYPSVTMMIRPTGTQIQRRSNSVGREKEGA